MIRRFFAEEREVYLLGLLRVAFAALLFAFSLRRAQELWQGGYFAERFHMPLWPDGLVPSKALYAALLGLQLAGCMAALVGLQARRALLVAACSGLFLFFCDRLQYHNNRYELLLLSFLVALTPCDRSFLPLAPPRAGLGPRWAARLVGAQVSIVYLASSLGKLFDPDWRGGTVLLLRFRPGQFIAGHFLPASVAHLLVEPWFAHLAALSAITTELFVALGLWFPRTRAVALWVGVMFHTGIELSAHVELFSFTMICSYLVFVTPELGQRALSFDLAQPRGRSLAQLLRRLDWLARFRHESAARNAELLRVTDAAGAEHAGLPAWRELARATPLLFPLWLPLALLTLRQTLRARALPSSRGAAAE